MLYGDHGDGLLKETRICTSFLSLSLAIEPANPQMPHALHCTYRNFLTCFSPHVVNHSRFQIYCASTHSIPRVRNIQTHGDMSDCSGHKSAASAPATAFGVLGTSFGWRFGDADIASFTTHRLSRGNGGMPYINHCTPGCQQIEAKLFLSDKCKYTSQRSTHKHIDIDHFLLHG